MKVRDAGRRARRAAEAVFGSQPCEFLASKEVRVENVEMHDTEVLVFFTLHEEPEMPWVLKVTPHDSAVSEVSGPLVEERIYKEVTGIQEIAPFVVTQLSFQCRDMNELVDKLTESRMKDHFLEMMSKFRDDFSLDEGAPVPVVLVFSKQRTGDDMHKFLVDHGPKIGYSDVLSLVGQIVVALSLFERHGIYHNDLHLHNVLVETREKPIALCFRWDDGEIVLPRSRHVVRIHNFDLSQSKENPVNGNLHDRYKDACREAEMCIRMGKRNGRDLAQILYHIKSVLESTTRTRGRNRVTTHSIELMRDLVGNDEWMDSKPSSHFWPGYPCYGIVNPKVCPCIPVHSNSAGDALRVLSRYLGGH